MLPPAWCRAGARVKFKDKVFTSPSYVPYFDAYKSHEFIVQDSKYKHIKLKCVTGDVIVQGWVHDDELELV